MPSMASSISRCRCDASGTIRAIGRPSRVMMIVSPFDIVEQLGEVGFGLGGLNLARHRHLSIGPIDQPRSRFADQNRSAPYKLSRRSRRVASWRRGRGSLSANLVDLLLEIGPEHGSGLCCGGLVVIAEADNVEPGVECRGHRCARPPQYAVDMQVLDHQRWCGRFELREQLHQSLIWAGECIA